MSVETAGDEAGAGALAADELGVLVGGLLAALAPPLGAAAGAGVRLATVWTTTRWRSATIMAVGTPLLPAAASMISPVASAEAIATMPSLRTHGSAAMRAFSGGGVQWDESWPNCPRMRWIFSAVAPITCPNSPRFPAL